MTSPARVARRLVGGARRWYREHPRRVFKRIHDANAWGSEESRSGVGSTLEQTAAVRAALPGLLDRLQVTSMLDMPCGDWNWMSRADLPGVRLVGADVVPDLISRNTHAFGARAEFAVLDARRDPLPTVDMIMMRDLLVHLSFRDIGEVFDNVQRSGARYVLMTTFVEPHRPNHDIRTGDWRPLNLQLPPFLLPEPLLSIDEQCTEYDGAFADKALAVWRTSDLPTGRTLSRRIASLPSARP